MKKYIKLLPVFITGCVIVLILASCKGKDSLDPIVVTDENGVVVTDENGEPMTVIPQTTQVYVTDANGAYVTDANGNKITTVVGVPIEVTIPVTNPDGSKVKDSDGKDVTKVITITPSIDETTNTTLYPTYPGGTTMVPLTDGEGNTATNAGGEVITVPIIPTEPPTAAPTPVNPTSWKTTFGGTLADYFSAVTALSDGGCVAINVTNSSDNDMLSIADSIGRPCSVIIKYDAQGAVMWKKAFGGNGATTLVSIAQTPDGGFVACGYSNATDLGVECRGSYDAIVVKFDSQGNKLWVKNFGTSTTDTFNGVAVAPSGDIIVAGSVGTNDGDIASLARTSRGSSASIVSYTSTGEVNWYRIIGDNMDRFNNVTVDSDNSIFAVGSFKNAKTNTTPYGIIVPKGEFDGVVAKLSAKGNTTWITSFGGSRNDIFDAICTTGDGGCVVAGYSRSADGELSALSTNKGNNDGIIVRFGKDSSVEWSVNFGGNAEDILESVVKVNGGYIAVGSTRSANRDLAVVGNHGGLDGLAVSVSDNGRVSWSQVFGGTKNDSFRCVAASPDGAFFAAGRSLSSDGDISDITSVKSGGQFDVGVISKFKG
ncbi:MAG: hypothetical protein GX051_06230 [Clostridiales bacterium]|nr:hypothetical protein [Clostridiales bacterium]